jgi:DMSO reductase anchor subunit
MLRARHVVFYFVPAACNIGLIIFLYWTSFNPRQQGFQTFVLFYSVGGLVVAVSAITALIHLSSRDQGDRRLLGLALVNAIIPTLLLLILLKVI